MYLREIEWGGFIWPRIGAGYCEYGDEPLGSGAKKLVI
jgi:hypothetical protein